MPETAFPSAALPIDGPDHSIAKLARAEDAAEHHARLEDASVPLALPENGAAIDRFGAEPFVHEELAFAKHARVRAWSG